MQSVIPFTRKEFTARYMVKSSIPSEKVAEIIAGEQSSDDADMNIGEMFEASNDGNMYRPELCSEYFVPSVGQILRSPYLADFLDAKSTLTLNQPARENRKSTHFVGKVVKRNFWGNYTITDTKPFPILETN